MRVQRILLSRFRKYTMMPILSVFFFFLLTFDFCFWNFRFIAQISQRLMDSLNFLLFYVCFKKTLYGVSQLLRTIYVWFRTFSLLFFFVYVSVFFLNIYILFVLYIENKKRELNQKKRKVQKLYVLVKKFVFCLIFFFKFDK